MNKKFINRVLIIFLILLLLSLLFKYFFPKNDNWNLDNSVIEEVDKYSSLWINPNSYDKLEDFLNDKNTLSKLKLDISKNDFVICMKDSKWNIIYTPFYHDFIKKWLFNNKEYKNEAIADIYNSYKNDCLKWWYKSDSKNKIVFEEDISHKDTNILNDIFTRTTNIDDSINELKKIPNKSIEKKEFISYLYDLKWNYIDADKNRKKTCLENEITCNKKNKFELYGKILDENNKPIPWVKVVLLNNPKYFILSNRKWEYSIDLEYYPFAHLRFKASKKWYSDWFKTISFNNSNWNWNKRENLNFNLTKAHYFVKATRDDVKNINSKDYFIFETKQSKYLVPIDWFYYKNWNKWNNNTLNVYMYEFKKSDNINDLVSSDTFSEASWYVWNLMKTFWMPYIQFIDEKTGKELFIYKSNPMILQNNIYHMQELYDNYDKIYEAITKEDMKYLVQYSKEKWWYPIDFEFLTKNNFLKWPAWWALDRKKWVWEAIPAKVLNSDWLIETQFYSINDL